MKIRPQGLGMWIAFPGMLNASWTAIATHCKALGVSWVAVRTTDQLLAGASLEGAVRAFHAAGIKFYGWHYSYPDAERVATQVAHMVRCQLAGADGHIVNAEIEFTGKRLEAVRLMEAVRVALPDWYVAHAPLGWISYHPTFPYEEFAAFCDDVHPQMYWSELKHGKYSAEFRAQIELWKKHTRHVGYDTESGADAKRICPIGVTYGRGDVKTKQQPPGAFDVADLRTFLETDVQTLPCFSLYSLEVAHPTALAYLRENWSWTPPDAA